ncbi:MAG TPA: hypothetical protein VI488_15710 [Candidatus Angelobacter sp.]
MQWQKKVLGWTRMMSALTLLVLFAAPAYASDKDKDKDKEDWDAYKLRFDAFWFYSQPSGTFTSKGNTGFFDLQADIGFNSYSTFTGKADWKFTRKNHLSFIATNFDQSKTVTFNRTVVFQGQTFAVGTVTSANLSARVLVPGYQYDFIRRKRWNLGAQVQLDIFDITGSLFAAAQVNHGVPQTAAFSSGSLRAPLPVAGPEIRFYPAKRLFVTANVLGMYFFGYGNFVSSQGNVGLKLTKNLAVRGGYQLGSRFNVNTKTQRLGVSLTQKGALVGLEISF